MPKKRRYLYGKKQHDIYPYLKRIEENFSCDPDLRNKLYEIIGEIYDDMFMKVKYGIITPTRKRKRRIDEKVGVKYKYDETKTIDI
jgi:hypothetical protein